MLGLKRKRSARGRIRYNAEGRELQRIGDRLDRIGERLVVDPVTDLRGKNLNDLLQSVVTTMGEEFGVVLSDTVIRYGDLKYDHGFRDGQEYILAHRTESAPAGPPTAPTPTTRGRRTRR